MRAMATKRARRPMSDEHKAALAEGRNQGRAVRGYLEALEAHKPKRGRKRTPDSIKKRLERIGRDGARLAARSQPGFGVDEAVRGDGVAARERAVGCGLLPHDQVGRPFLREVKPAVPPLLVFELLLHQVGQRIELPFAQFQHRQRRLGLAINKVPGGVAVDVQPVAGQPGRYSVSGVPIPAVDGSEPVGW